MAIKETDRCIKEFEEITSSLKMGIFKPFYLLMGTEPYYSDKIIEEITTRALTPEERGFNQIITYGSDITASGVVELARRYPMASSKQVVVVKEAQLLDKPDDLIHYFRNPTPTTVLVVSLTNKSLDKRGVLYKTALKNGVVFESVPLKEEAVYLWVERFLKSKGYTVTPEACMLISDHCGTELRKLVLELEKLTVNLDADIKHIDSLDVEKNIGVSREYNIYELTKAVSYKDKQKIYKLIKHFSASPKQFPFPVILVYLFMHFVKILKYHASYAKGARPSRGELAALIGVNPYFLTEYEAAANNYPLRKCMEAIAYMRKYDSIAKSNLRGESQDGDLLLELVYRITH